MPRKIHPVSAEFPYHITARCTNRDWFAVPLPEVWDIMERYLFFLHHAFSFRIHSFVLMTNHFHLLASTPEANLSEGMRYFMTETSRSLLKGSRRINQIYGQRYFRTLIKSEHYFRHAYKYVYRNPVSAGACLKVESYPFSTLQGLLGSSRLVIPVEDDPIIFDENSDAALRWLNAAANPEDWEDVKNAMRGREFLLTRRRGRANPLEIDAL